MKLINKKLSPQHLSPLKRWICATNTAVCSHKTIPSSMVHLLAYMHRVLTDMRPAWIALQGLWFLQQDIASWLHAWGYRRETGSRSSIPWMIACNLIGMQNWGRLTGQERIKVIKYPILSIYKIGGYSPIRKSTEDITMSQDSPLLMVALFPAKCNPYNFSLLNSGLHQLKIMFTQMLPMFSSFKTWPNHSGFPCSKTLLLCFSCLAVGNEVAVMHFKRLLLLFHIL